MAAGISLKKFEGLLERRIASSRSAVIREQKRGRFGSGNDRRIRERVRRAGVREECQPPTARAHTPHS